MNGDVPFTLITLFNGKPADYNGWVQVPYGKIGYFGPANVTDKSVPILGVTLGGRWTTETSIAVKGYLPSTDSIVVLLIQNVQFIKHNMPAPEWKWPTQEAAPAYSLEHGTYRILSDSAAKELLATDNVSPDPPTVPPSGTTEDATVVIPTVTPPLSTEDAITSTHTLETSDTAEDDTADDDATDAPTLYVPSSAQWQRTLLDHDSVDRFAFPITHEQALKGIHAADANPAVDDELTNMNDNNVWSCVDYTQLSKEDIASAVPSGLYIKYKSNPADGSYQKSKARLHAGGHKQRSDNCTATASWMINIMVVFITLKLMAALGWLHAVYDIKGAILHASRTNCKPQYMKLTARLTALWVAKHPNDAKLVHKECLYVLLNKALYGLKDSGRLWYDHLTTFLLSIGFAICQSDPCLYCKWLSPNNFAYVLTHVDDLLVVGLGPAFNSFKGLLAGSFPDFTEQLKATFSYLGMTVIRDYDQHSLTINQRSYIATMLETFGMTECTPVASPSTAELLQPKEDVSAKCDITLYLSIVMSLMYLARISRPDVLFVVPFLATKSAGPTEMDLIAVKRVLCFLKGTINLALRFVGRTIDIVIYADASHGVHPDGKGHYSTVIVIGGSEVLRTSQKMKCVTLSST